MSTITEEQLKKLREAWVKVPGVNQDCIWCSACVAIAGEVFELNDEWRSEVQKRDSYNQDDVNDAICACPVDAIYWEE